MTEGVFLKKFEKKKAIGWTVREWAKTNPEEVKNFVANNNLILLSTKEA